MEQTITQLSLFISSFNVAGSNEVIFWIRLIPKITIN